MKQNKKRKRNKKEGFSLKALFTNKKYRYLAMVLMMLPFIVAIAIFSTIAYREAKSMANMASGNVVAEAKPENVIGDSWYVLRDNATDLQKEYFAELKDAIENGAADDATIAGLIGKNYVADFYTWTNKAGQYDVGGMYYVYDGQFVNGDHFKDNVYLKARDGFYKYLSTYSTKYGKENLLEVEDVEIVKCEKMSSKYIINEHIENRQDAEGEWYDYREDVPYDAYSVSLRWTYKEGTSLTTSQFANAINLAVIQREGKWEIVEASESIINARKGSQENSVEETATDTQTETAA